eukprot:156088_1
MKIFVLGGDGFCGWPNALRLSSKGHDVWILDNLSRRYIDHKLGTASLVPIVSIQERVRTWLTVKPDAKLCCVQIDIAKDYEKFANLINSESPDVVVHMAEQRSAPYSMRSAETARYTVDNNLNATHNVCQALARCPRRDIHLIHLGTMGVYGYGAVPDTVIPEGYVDVTMQGKSVSILHPAYPGSIYHMTKTQDALMFQFYAKNYGLRITDLHQGIIWGMQTAETSLHADLSNRVDFDETYGTCLNRFCVQALCDYPLTLYGTGEQTRAFIHMQNSADCVELAIANPPECGDRVRIRNQMTQCLQLKALAEMICTVHPSATIQNVPNPRKELPANSLSVDNRSFLDIGLEPILVDEARLRAILESMRAHRDRFTSNTVLPSSMWDPHSKE